MDHIWFVGFHLFLGISGIEITNFNIILTIGPSYRDIQASKSPKKSLNPPKMTKYGTTIKF
jgi:hypothetical protein